MSRIYKRRADFVPALKISAVAVGLAIAGNTQAIELKFDNGATGSFDTTISYGVSVRTDSPAADLIAIANGGTSRSANEDDGDRNYKKGQAFSNLLKVTHDLELKYNGWGFFGRGLYFVDFANDNKSTLGPEAKDRIGRNAQMLDAFVSKSFAVGDTSSLKMRVGNQVISWGESTFIPGGINATNPVDLSKLRTPGSELKEAFIPTTSVWGSLDLTANASVEAYMLTNWDKIRIDPKGSYWSNNDAVSPDSTNVILSFGRRHDLSYGRIPGNLVPPTNPAYATAVALFGPFDPAGAVWEPRSADHNAHDRGQYGFAFRYLAKELNNTEFGIYFENNHSRVPVFEAIKGTPTTGQTGTPFNGGNTGTATYYAAYPENIRLFGFSFNTEGPAGIALQGEFSYRPNQPLGYSSVETILASLGLPNQVTGYQIIPGTTVGAAAPFGISAAYLVPDGTTIQGWERVKMTQAQVTATKAFPNVMGSEQLVLVGEVGFTQYPGLRTDIAFAGPGTYLPATAQGAFGFSQAGSVQPGGFVTKNSWGYRLAGKMEYSNLMFGANVAPRFAYSDDVSGVSQTFNEGVKSYSLGVNFDWQRRWTFDVSYTGFTGGRTFCGTDTVTNAAAQSSLAAQIAGVAPLGIPGQGANWCSSANPYHDRSFYSVVATYSF